MIQKVAFSLLALMLTMSVHAEEKIPAQCKKDFISLQDRKSVTILPGRTVTVVAGTDLSKLRRVESQAVNDYAKYIDPEMPEWGLEITTRQYQSKDDKATLGYRVKVNGGDEAVATFYYKLDVGIYDVVDQLLYYFWDNQSPVREWVCRGY